jgi:hypothetical protein
MYVHEEPAYRQASYRSRHSERFCSSVSWRLWYIIVNQSLHISN